MFKVGVLYRVQQFLQLIVDHSLSVQEFHHHFSLFRDVHAEYITDLALTMGWVRSDGDSVCITPRGLEVLQRSDAKLMLRLQLADVVTILRPPWAALSVQGRKALRRYAEVDTVQCLSEAGLLDEYDPEVALWWDQLAAVFRQVRDQSLVALGRKGEILSIEYEKERTGLHPDWIALENSSAGYDLLSRVDRDCSDRLLVEVKASTRDFDAAVFFLSRNEWNVLSSAPNAVVHLWSSVESIPQLRLLHLEKIAVHVPNDCGKGTWQNVTVPFGV